MRTVFLLACAPLVACTASSNEVHPHENDDKAIFYPTGLGIAPDDSVLFLANANSELRYDSGSVIVLDLALADQIAAAWTSPSKMFPDGCYQEADHLETLICSEERFIMSGAGARIGNFATDIAVQDFKAGGPLRLIVPTRGDPSVAWIDWDGSKLSCSNTPGFSLCDESHRLSYVHNDPNVGLLPDEPFDAFAGPDYAVVTHLTTGAITLIDSPQGAPAMIADVALGLFAPDPLTGIRGSTGVAGRGDSGLVYVGSRSEDRIQTMSVGRPVNGNIAPPYIIPEAYFFLDLVGGNAGGSTDTRGMAFSANGDRMYLINRRPPSLQIYDTSLDIGGAPRNKGIAATDICRDASTLSVIDAGEGDRVYITCFSDGEIYVVDPRGAASVEDIISVGRGPYAVVAAPTRKKIYVTNFLEDTVAVIDVDPTSPTHDRVVLRIGVPKTP